MHAPALRTWTVLLLSAVLLWPALSAAQPSTVDIREWPVPWPNTRPRDPAVAPDGRIWFVGQTGDYVAVFDPDSEAFSKHDLNDGVGPHNVIVDAGGAVWYAGNRDQHIGRLQSAIGPDIGKVERIEMPLEAARDPHTLIEDGNGHIWFTVQHGNFIGRLDMKTRQVELLPVPTKNARPYGIIADPQGRPWVALLGTNKLATVDPADMKLTEIELPREDARPRRIGRTADGHIWYVDYAQGYLGGYAPETGEFREWKTPSEHAGPYAMAVDGEDRIWFVETIPQPNRFVGFDPETERFFSQTPVPSGGGSVRHMVFDPERNAIWFGTDTGNIGRAEVPD